MCNTWSQNIIEAAKENGYLSCMGHIFAIFARVFEPCISAKVITGDKRLFALVVRKEEGKKQLYVINHSGEDIEAELPEGSWQWK
jgi:hypothetical protein